MGRRIALLVVAVSTVLVSGAGVASAAGGSYPVPPGRGRSECNNVMCTLVYLDGVLGHNANGMGAQLRNTARKGHFEFFGPAGHIADSPDKTWAVNEYYSTSRFMHGNRGDLWCGRFWVYTSSGWTSPSGNVCVKG